MLAGFTRGILQGPHRHGTRKGQGGIPVERSHGVEPGALPGEVVFDTTHHQGRAHPVVLRAQLGRGQPVSGDDAVIEGLSRAVIAHGTPEGEPLGTHRGLAFYTLGQRAGLGVGGRPGRAEQPWYVAAKDAARNTLVIVQGQDHPLLESGALVTAPWHWLIEPREARSRCTVKVRYRQADQAAQIAPRADGTADIHFDEPQRAVTPGQYAVAYDGTRCLGGGVIASVAAAARAAVAA